MKKLLALILCVINLKNIFTFEHYVAEKNAASDIVVVNKAQEFRLMQAICSKSIKCIKP